MRKLLGLLLACAFAALAQQATPQTPDCQLQFILTATSANSTNFDNRFIGCNVWTLSYTAYNASVVSVQMNSAPDAGGVPGTWTIFGVALTNTSYSSEAQSAYTPWLQVASTITFSAGGFVKGVVVGWRPGPVATTPNIPVPPPTPGICSTTSTPCVSIASLQTADPYPTSGGFVGYADATIRQDPQSGYLWMAYSWLHVTTGSTAPPCVAGIQGVNTHLAYSTNGGVTWLYYGPLFTDACVTDPITPANSDYTSREVVNLLPQVVGGVTYWYMFAQEYYLVNSAGHTQVSGSIRWYVAIAAGTASTGPSGLASATNYEYLGTPSTNATGWPYAQNLSTLASDVNVCHAYFEPWLNLPGGTTLYLGLDCQNSGGAFPFYAQFSTPNPQGVGNWISNPPVWSYVGGGAATTPFATAAQAQTLCTLLTTATVCNANQVYITQMDVAPSSNSANQVAIYSLVYLNPAKISLGCMVSPLVVSAGNVVYPAAFQTSGGNIITSVTLTSPDSTTTGPGSCTYSPFSSTGVILAHKETNCTGGSPGCSTQGGFFSYLMGSTLLP